MQLTETSSGESKLDNSTLIGHFGESLIPVIAGAAGCTYAKPMPDRGVDWKVQADASDDDLEPEVHIQVKTTTSARENADGSLSVTLWVHDYNKLVKKTTVPRILVVVVIPKQRTRWLQHNQDHVRAEKCLYWMHLEGHPPSCNGAKCTVRVQRNRQFTAAALKGMLRRISNGGRP
jgi:hypothetical protein